MNNEYSGGTHSGGTLAYLGDAVMEVWVRELLLSFGITKTSVCSTEAVKFVSAKAQCRAYESISDTLTEHEAEIFRRGRNAHVTVPKSAGSYEYHTSTGFEALIGSLWLDGERERINELLSNAYRDKIDDLMRRHELDGAKISKGDSQNEKN